MSAADRARAIAVAQVVEFMRKKNLTLDDLVNVGGQDLKSPDKSKDGKARCVENAWALMARIGVKYADLEQSEPSPRPVPDFSARIRRGERAI
jgi:hypothetical protein